MLVRVKPILVIYFQLHIATLALENKTFLMEIIKKCLEAKEIDKRTELMQNLNNLLALEYRIQLPSLITNDYLDKTLIC